MDFGLAALATSLSLAFSVVLFRKFADRRRGHYAAWGTSMACFAVGSLALTLGIALGWNPVSFRVYYAAGAILTVPWLGLGTILLLSNRVSDAIDAGVQDAKPAVRDRPPFELAALSLPRNIRLRLMVERAPKRRRSLAERRIRWTSAVVVLSTIAACVALSTPFVKALPVSGVPEGKAMFPFLPRFFAVLANIVGTVLVVAGMVWSTLRARRYRGNGALVQGNILIAVGVVVAAFGGTILGLGLAASKAAYLAVAVTLIFTGYIRSTQAASARAVEATPSAVPTEPPDAPASAVPTEPPDAPASAVPTEPPADATPASA